MTSSLHSGFYNLILVRSVIHIMYGEVSTSSLLQISLGPLKRLKNETLARRLSWLEHHSVHQKAVGSIPGQGHT